MDTDRPALFKHVQPVRAGHTATLMGDAGCHDTAREATLATPRPATVGVEFAAV